MSAVEPRGPGPPGLGSGGLVTLVASRGMERPTRMAPGQQHVCRGLWHFYRSVSCHGPTLWPRPVVPLCVQAESGGSPGVALRPQLTSALW